MFEVLPITGTFGAEIEGIDLAAELDDAVVAKLKETFLAYKVLVFHNQHTVEPEHHVRLGRLFGSLEIHPFYPQLDDHPEVIVLRTDATGGARESWHSDVSFRATPPLGSILRAIEVPPYGRDTAFADMEAVYQNLSPKLQQMVSDLTAIHDWRHVFKTNPEGEGDAADALPPVEHPVVRTHPETGRKSIYVNRVFTTRIAGLRSHESEVILRLLCDEVHLPEHQLRCRWYPGTIAMWDNRAVQHALVFDRSFPRVMQRVTIAGDRPF